MDAKEAKKVLTKPQIQRLKQMTSGLEVGKVLGERVLVKLVEPYTEMDRLEKEGILVIPETNRESNTPLPTTGIVVAVGRGGEPGHLLELAEGDMILFSKYAGTDIYLNEEAFRIMDVREVLCTLVETKPTGVAVMPYNPGA